MWPFVRRDRSGLRSQKSTAERELEAIRMARQEIPCGVLIETGRLVPSEFVMPLPDYVYGWAGRVVGVQDRSSSMPWFKFSSGRQVDPEFRFIESGQTEPTMGGRVYRYERRYCATTVHDDVEGYLIEKSRFHLARREACSEDPGEPLLQFISVNRHLCNLQCRGHVGGRPYWDQYDDTPVCNRCFRSMNLILQVPGEMIPGGRRTATYYCFGCVDHPDTIRTVSQDY